MSRAAIRADLDTVRALNIEAKALRARLDQVASARADLSVAAIAIRHGATPELVQSIAKAMHWTTDEKPPLGALPPYDAYHAA